MTNFLYIQESKTTSPIQKNYRPKTFIFRLSAYNLFIEEENVKKPLQVYHDIEP